MNSIAVIIEASLPRDLPESIQNTDGSVVYHLSSVQGSSDAGDAFLDTVYGVLNTRETARVEKLDQISRSLNIDNPTESKLGKALLSKLTKRHPKSDDTALLSLKSLLDTHLGFDLPNLKIVMVDAEGIINPRLPKRDTLKNKINTLANDRRLLLAYYQQSNLK